MENNTTSMMEPVIEITEYALYLSKFYVLLWSRRTKYYSIKCLHSCIVRIRIENNRRKKITISTIYCQICINITRIQYRSINGKYPITCCLA